MRFASTQRRMTSGPGRPGPFFVLRRLALIAPLLLLLGSPAANGAVDDAVQFELHSDRHSDGLRLSQFGTDDATLLTPRPGRNLVYLRDELRLSAPFAGGQIALLARQAATLVASPGALAVAIDLDTSGSPTSDYQHAVHLRYTGFAGGGLAWRGGSEPGRDLAAPLQASRPFEAAGWHWQAGVQLLQLQRLTWRNIDGQVHYAAATEGYSFDLDSDRGDNKLKLPYQRTFAKTGVASLFDAHLVHCEAEHCWGIGARDLGRLRWRGLPRDQARLSSNTQTVDSNGYLIYKPLVEGHDSQDDVTLSAPASVDLDARWQLAPQWQLALRGEWLQSYGWLPSARASWQPALGPAWGVSWQVHERRLGLEASGERWTLRYAADRFGAGAKSRELLLNWNWPLN